MTTPLRLTVLALILLAWQSATAAAGDAEARYFALMRDGSQTTGSALQLQDATHVTLDGRELLDPKNPVWVLCDTTLAWQLRTPYVEFTNGDVLPGRVKEYVSADDETGSPEHLVIVPQESPQSAAAPATEVRARPDAVRRVVFAGRSDRGLPAGQIAFRNGVRAPVRSLRWSSGGVRALGEDKIVSAEFDAIAEIHLPERDAMAGVLADAVLAQNTLDDVLLRIRTTDGGQLTFPRTMAVVRRPEGKSEPPILAAQPSWALRPAEVPLGQIVFCTYRRPGEVPLSLLPTAWVRQKPAVHAWPWRANESVLGKPLRSGPLWADLGVGTHSSCEIAFELPPGAKEFSTFVGLDHSVGVGGCVQCRVVRDESAGAPLWKSGFLQGGKPPERVGPLPVAGVKRLVLATDFGHEGRPAGADPFDIRDHVDWLLPEVSADLGKVPVDLPAVVPALRGWEVSDAMRERIKFRPFWHESRRQWRWPIVNVRPGDRPELEFSRRLRVTLASAWLTVEAGRDDKGYGGHEIAVRVDGKDHESLAGGNLRDEQRQPGDGEPRDWALSAFAGQEVTVTVVVRWGGPGGDQAQGLLLDRLTLRPLVRGLPPDGKPIVPQTPLESLTAEKIAIQGKSPPLEAGKLTNGQPLAVRGWPFATGFGAPQGSEITYALDPAWRRFVAVVGLADGSQEIGPYEILLDGQPHWQSKEPAKFGPRTPAWQIDVPIPPDHKTITLRLEGGEGFGAWAAAGFMNISSTEPETRTP
jgi:hypothetical protein